MSPKPFKSHMFTKMCKKSHFWPKIPNMVIWTQISQKHKILNFFLKNEKFLPIAFQIAIKHYLIMIFWKDIAKLPKFGYLGPGPLYTCLVQN